jgi:molybdopterin/thiamine biosynthesis adenylyltransferase
MKKIVIVGVGALGSHVALLLRNLDMQNVPGKPGELFRLVAVDFDRVEQKNTLAQFHGKASVGKNKALGLQQTVNFLFGVKIDAVPHKLVAENVQVLLRDATLVIDCLDNGPSRRIVQNFVRECQVPCVHGALAANGTIGRVVWDDKFVIDENDGEGATCEDGEHLPFIGLVSAHLARAAQEFLKSRQQMSFQVFSRSPSISL